MGYQSIFQRYEIKYVITKKQKEIIKSEVKDFTVQDKYGKNTICNIYFDTPKGLLVRRSMEKPVYKEKLRVRSYGIAEPESTVFVELKKKYKSVVYKRRVSMSDENAELYLRGKEFGLSPTQILMEINYFMDMYQNLQPMMYISYEREALCGRNDGDFRITFDENIKWRNWDLSLREGNYGEALLQEDEVLMELKTGGGMPLWMVHVLSENCMYKTSFSKYAKAYMAMASGGEEYGN